EFDVENAQVPDRTDRVLHFAAGRAYDRERYLSDREAAAFRWRGLSIPHQERERSLRACGQGKPARPLLIRSGARNRREAAQEGCDPPAKFRPGGGGNGTHVRVCRTVDSGLRPGERGLGVAAMVGGGRRGGLGRILRLYPWPCRARRDDRSV